MKDLEFEDDISLLSYKEEDAQEKSHIGEKAEKIGLQINIRKTEVI